MARLLAHDWPGNVQELQTVLEEALLRASGGPLRLWPAPKKSAGRAADRDMPPLDEYLTGYFRRLLEACGGRIAGPGGAAEMAGLHPNTLRSRLDKLGISYHTRNPGRD